MRTSPPATRRGVIALANRNSTGFRPPNFGRRPATRTPSRKVDDHPVFPSGNAGPYTPACPIPHHPDRQIEGAVSFQFLRQRISFTEKCGRCGSEMAAGEICPEPRDGVPNGGSRWGQFGLLDVLSSRRFCHNHRISAPIASPWRILSHIALRGDSGRCPHGVTTIFPRPTVLCRRRLLPPISGAASPSNRTAICS